MIIKMDEECIISDFKSAIGYHENKIKKEVASQLTSTHPFSKSIQSKAKPFEIVTNLNNRVKVKGMDIPFSFDKTDKIDDDTFIKLFEEYSKDFNFENRPYIIYKHEDTDNIHYHAIISNCDYQGNVNPVLSSFYRRDVTLWAREKEKEYGFKQLKGVGEGKQSISLNELNFDKYSYSRALLKAKNDGHFVELEKDDIYGKSNYLIKNLLNDNFSNTMKFLLENKYLNEKNKTKLINVLDSVIENIPKDKFNLELFFENVRKEGFYARELKRTKPRKISYGILKDDGKYQYFRSDQLPQRFSYKNLLNNKSTNFTIDKQKSFIKNIVSRAAKQSTSYDEFITFLNSKGVGVEELKNDKFGIYGLKYYSNNINDPYYFNSSDIGREFSFANLNKNWEKLLDTPEVKLDSANISKSKPKSTGQFSKRIDPASNKSEEGDVTKKERTGSLDDDNRKQKGRGR